MKFFIIATLLAYTPANAATIKQLLNDQDLVVLELEKGETTAMGENFISSNEKTQCLVEVLSIKERIVNATSKRCNDKTSLSVGKKVEKSLIDPSNLKQEPAAVQGNPSSASPPSQSEPPAPPAAQENTSPIGPSRIAPHDLNFWPKQNQLAVGAALASNKYKIENDDTGFTLDSRYDLLNVKLGFGFSNNFSAAINLRSITGGDPDTGNQASIFELALHSDPLVSEDIISVGVSYCPKGDDDDALASNFAGFSISAGKIYSDSSYLIKAESVAFAETDSLKSRSSSVLSATYQTNLSPVSFMQLGAAVQTFSTEEYKDVNLKFEYSPMLSLGVGIGITNPSKSFSGLVSLESFAAKVTAKSTSDTDLTYTGSSLKFSAAAAF
jgi:hypothetical protein